MVYTFHSYLLQFLLIVFNCTPLHLAKQAKLNSDYKVHIVPSTPFLIELN